MLLVFYNLLNSQNNLSINSSEKRLITRTPPTKAKKAVEIAQKKEQ